MANSEQIGQIATRVETALRGHDNARQAMMDGINRDLGRLSANDRTALPQLTAELERRGALPQLVIAEFGNQGTMSRLGTERVTATNLGQIANGDRGTAGERATPLDRIAAREMHDTYMRGRTEGLSPEQVQAHYQRVQLAGGMRNAIDNLRDIFPQIATSRDSMTGLTGNRALTQEDIQKALGSQSLTLNQRASLQFLDTNFRQVTDSIQSRWIGSRVISLQDMERALSGGLESSLVEHQALTDGRVGAGTNPGATPAEARAAALVEQGTAQQGDGPDRIARRLLGQAASNADVIGLSNEMMRLFSERHQERRLVAQNGRQVLERLHPGEQLLSAEDLPALAQRFAALRTDR